MAFVRVHTPAAAIVLSLLLSLPSATDARESVAFQRPEQRERYQRLERFANVVVDWHCHVADATTEQRRQLQRALLANALTIAKQASFRQENYTLATFASIRPNAGRVLLEGRAWKRGPSAWDKAVTAALSERQNKAISTSLVKRRVAEIQRSAAATAAYLQHIAGLTDEQGQQVQTHLLNQLGKDLLAHPVSVATLPQLRLLDDPIVSRVMEGRGEALRRQLRGQSIDSQLKYHAELQVRPSDDSDTKKSKAIDRAIQPAMQQAEIAHKATVSLLAERYNLCEKQHRRLILAGKGIRARRRSIWHHQLSDEYDKTQEKWKRAAGVPTIPVAISLTMDPLRTDPIWTKALDHVIGASAASWTSAAIQKGLVEQQMVIFDGELWLRPDQHDAFEELLRSAARTAQPAATVPQLSDLVRRTALQLPDAEVKKLLTPNQMKVLDFLRSPTPVR